MTSTLRRRAWTAKMVIAGASAGALLGGCEDNNRAATSAKELWSRVQPIYTSWSSPSAFKELRPSETLHKRKVRVFFNDLMQPHHVDRETCQQRADEGVSGGVIVAEAGLTEWPLGSVIVKEGHDDGLEIIAMMEKRDHGWFYAEYDASGEVLFSGKSPQLCVSCHAGALHDFTFTAHLSYKCP